MAIKIKKIFFAVFFFCFLPCLFSPASLTAQESRSFHRFSWSGGEYSLRYEVVFELMEDDTYISYLREFTEFNYVDVSLPPGEYRFQVIPYDVLDRPAEASEWRHFLVLQAMQTIPETPQPSSLPEEPVQELVSEAEPEQQTEPEIEPEPGQRRGIDPLKPVLINVGIAWSPFMPVYGESQYGDISLIGASVRAGAAFRLPLNFYLGFELKAFFDMDDTMFLNAGINMLVLKWIADNRLAFGVRLGAAFTVIPFPDDSFSADKIMPDIGAFLRWRITNIFLLEGGIDFWHVFTDVPAGYMRPWIGFGVQF